MQNLARNKHVRVDVLNFNTFLSILNLVVALFFLVDPVQVVEWSKSHIHEGITKKQGENYEKTFRPVYPKSQTDHLWRKELQI